MSTAEFVSLFSNRGKSIVLTIAIPLLLVLGTVAWQDMKPSAVVAPVIHQVQQLETSVSAIEQRVQRIERSSVLLDYRFASIERYLCLDSRKRAVLAGIDCAKLVP